MYEMSTGLVLSNRHIYRLLFVKTQRLESSSAFLNLYRKWERNPYFH
jgi:hypothetical protein